MKMKEFIDKLADYRGKLRLRDGRIRCRGQCPIDALGGDWLKPDGGLGLSEDAVDLIIGAADNNSGAETQAIRRRMLKALDLSE